MTIREAKRESIPLLISISGPSGSGKTYSALSLASGLAGDGKVGFLDSELGRGSMYADDADLMKGMPGGKYHIADITAPFSPAKYSKIIKDFIDFGVSVLVIDSISHEWAGVGGCQEIAESNKLGGLPNWAKAKMEHKKLMNMATQCPMHIIFCLRAAEKTKPVKNENGKIEMVEEGLQPIQEKNFMYEMTLSMMMDWKNPGKPQITKCPKPLLNLFSSNEAFITKSTGEKLKAWADGGESIDTQLRNLKREFRDAASFGAEKLKAMHARLKIENDDLLKKVWTVDFAEEVKNLAKEADQISDEPTDEENSEVINEAQRKLFDKVGTDKD